MRRGVMRLAASIVVLGGLCGGGRATLAGAAGKGARQAAAHAQPSAPITGVAVWASGTGYYNLRTAPRADAPLDGTLQPGDSVHVLGAVPSVSGGDPWYRLLVGTRVVYVLSTGIGYLHVATPWSGVASANGESGVGVVYSLAAPRADAPVEASFAPGQEMTVLGEARGAALEPGNATWYRVSTGSYRPAYVYSAYLKLVRLGPGPIPVPTLTAAEALAVDLKTLRPLYSLNPNAPRAPASLVKMMTAAVALDHFGPAGVNTPITVPPDAQSVGTEVDGSSMGLLPGERLSLHDLLYGLLLPSGNDAAYTIANAVAGSQDSFAKLMNVKAAAIGLKDTHYAQSYGLDAPGQVTTAWDLARLARYDLEHYPLFDQIVKTVNHTIGKGLTHRAYALHNTNQLLGVYPGAFGVKTGTTAAAGENLVAADERDGHRVLIVIMGATDRYADGSALLDYAIAADSR